MTTKSRYRILFDSRYPEHPDFWKVGTDLFGFICDDKTCFNWEGLKRINILKTRIL